RRGERLAVLGTGLAHEGAHVDEAGRNHAAAAVDDLGARGHARGMDAAFGFTDPAVGDQHVAFDVEIARGIDHAAVGEQDGTAIGEHGLDHLTRAKANSEWSMVSRFRCFAFHSLLTTQYSLLTIRYSPASSRVRQRA